MKMDSFITLVVTHKRDVFPILTNFAFTGLIILISKGEMLLSKGKTMIPLNYTLRLPPGHFGFLMTVNQWVSKGVSLLARKINYDFKGKLGCYCVTSVRRMSGIQNTC